MITVLKNTLVTLLLASTIVGWQFAFSGQAFAQPTDMCTPGECVGGYVCGCMNTANGPICFADPNQPCGAQTGVEVIGEVTPPAAIREWRFANGYSQIGIVNFLSTVIRLLTIVGGILTMINFVWAGFIYVTSASSSNTAETVKEKMTYGAIGLVIIVSAYTLAGIIGIVFFGNASFILAPQLEGALGTTP